MPFRCQFSTAKPNWVPRPRSVSSLFSSSPEPDAASLTYSGSSKDEGLKFASISQLTRFVYFFNTGDKGNPQCLCQPFCKIRNQRGVVFRRDTGDPFRGLFRFPLADHLYTGRYQLIGKPVVFIFAFMNQLPPTGIPP
jgi:hypothetical protein